MKSISYQKENNYKIKMSSYLWTLASYLKSSYLLFIVFTLFIGSHTVFAQPVISLDQGSINFGDTWSHITEIRVLKVTNNGNATLEISSFSWNGDNFSFVTSPNLPMTLAPSQSVDLRIKFESNTAGYKNGGLTLYHNAGSTNVQLSANVLGISLDVTPSIDFGIVAVNSQETRQVTVTNTGVNAITITGVSIRGGDGFTVTPVSTTISPGGSTNISVTFRPTSAGSKEATLSISMVIASSGIQWDVSLRGNRASTGRPIILTSLNAIDFGGVPIGTSNTYPILITNRGNAPLIISSTSIVNGARFSLPNNASNITINPGDSYEITVQFSPNAEQDYTGTLRIIHNDTETGSPTDISLSGWGYRYVEAPNICLIDRSEIYFGYIAVGSSIVDIIRIGNCGNVDLVISSLAISPNVFTLPRGERSLRMAPGEVYELAVQFRPTAGTSYTGTLRLTHNASGSPTDIPLNGYGMASAGPGIPNISVSPQRIEFGGVFIGTTKDERVTITNPGTAALTISNIITEQWNESMSAGEFEFVGTLPTTIPAGGSRDITVRFKPSVSSGFNWRYAYLIIDHNAPERYPDRIYIAMNGYGYYSSLDIVPGSIDFGTVPVGLESEQKEISITNNSTIDVDLDVRFADVNNENNSSFIITPTSLSVKVNETKKISVSFKPTSAGPISNDLRIGGGQYSIGLSGIGFQAAILEIEPTGIDFGNVALGDSPVTVEDFVRITNSGNDPLVISLIYITGGVFGLKNGENSMTIPPGEFRDLYVQFTPNDIFSSIGTITLTHNAEGLSTDIPLTGRGTRTGLAGLVGVPEEIDFGDVLIGRFGGKDTTFPIINNDIVPLTIDGAQIVGADAGNFMLGEDMYYTFSEGESRYFYMEFHPTSLGEKTATMDIYHSSVGPVPYPIQVTLKGKGVLPNIPIIEIEPISIDFDNVIVGTAPQKNVRIKNNGGATLVISSASIAGYNFILPNNETLIEVGSDGYHDLFVQFLPNEITGYADTLTLVHNGYIPNTEIYLPTDPEYLWASPSIIPLSGNGVQPIIAINPTSIDFGNVMVDNSLQRSVRITNDGTANLVISSMKVTGADSTLFTFTLTSPITIAPSRSSDITVQFLPTSIGIKSAELNINNNSPDSVAVVPLTGTGIYVSADIFPVAINFGTLQIGSQSDSAVYITNTGSINMNITEVNITGDANQFIVNPVQVILGPNESQRIPVTFRPTSLGSKQATLNIVTLTGELTVQLTGTGDGKAVIAIDPKSIDFGPIILGGSLQRNVSIRNNGNIDLEISSMDFAGTDANLFTFAPTPPIIIPPSIDTTLTINFLPTSVGVKNANLNITHNADGSPDIVQLTGEGITARADVLPNAINFGSVQIGLQSDSAVYVTNTGGTDINITGANITGGDADLFVTSSVTVTLRPEQSQRIPVSFKPTSLGSKQATLNITTSIGTLTAQLNGTGAGTPIIIIDIIDPSTGSASINFGDVLMNSSRDTTLTITNNGNADLIISSMNITGTDATLFSITPSSITIPYSQSRDITVKFLPTSIGVKSAELNINHNGSPSTTIVPLTGRGVQADIVLNPRDSINFGSVPVNSPSSNRYITITNRGTASLTITNLQITGTDASMFKRVSSPDSNSFQSIIIGAGSSFTFTFNFTPASAEVKNARVSFTHSLGSSEVAFTGIGLVPVISVTPNSLDFGEVRVGAPPLPRTVTITNSGAAPLIISSVTTSQNVFTLPNGETPITIPPSSSYNLTIGFSPTAITDYTGTLTLTHNANSSPSVVSLQGTGIFSELRIGIPKNYIVKANEEVKVSVQAMEDLSERKARSFSFVLRYNKRILSFSYVLLTGTMSSMHSVSTGGSTPGELVIRVTNTTGEPLIGIGSLIDINFIGLRGDSCGTQLILESFEFNSDGPHATTENGYCELFGKCGEEQTYVTTDQSTRVYQNNPNPIQEGYESTIQYRINVAGEATLIVYDILGREVTKLVNEYKSEGTYSVTFNTKGLPSGVYFYRLRAPGYEGLKKMVIVR